MRHRAKFHGDRSKRHMDVNVWAYPRPGYIFQVSSKSVQGFRSPRGSKFGISHYLAIRFYNSLYYRTSRDMDGVSLVQTDRQTDRQTDMTDVDDWQRASSSQRDELMMCETVGVDDHLPQHTAAHDSSGNKRLHGGDRACAGCQLAIRDRHYLSAVDADWHTTCLVCSVCQMSLDSQPTCYVKDSRIYCKHDYFKSVLHSPTLLLFIRLVKYCFKNLSSYVIALCTLALKQSAELNQRERPVRFHLCLSSFLPRDAMLAQYTLSSYVPPSVRPSVCLSQAGTVLYQND